MADSVKLYQSNKLTEARYSLSVIEKRCLYLIIREVRKKFIDTDQGDRTLFDHMLVNFSAEDLTAVAEEKNIHKVYSALKNLRTRHITVDNEEIWMNTGFINSSLHKKGSGKIELEVSKLIIPYLVNLAKNYTAYSLNVALSLKSEYSQRFYELCSQWKNAGGFKKTLEDLKQIFELERKYSKYTDFKKRVLEPAQKELKALFDKGECDLYFNYSEIKQGRKITTLSFKIVSGEQETAEIKEIYYFVAKDLYAMFEVIKKSKNRKFIDACLNKMHLNPELLNHIKNKLNYASQMQYPAEVKVPYIRHILNEDIIGADMEKLKQQREKENKKTLKEIQKKQRSNEDEFKSFNTLFD